MRKTMTSIEINKLLGKYQNNLKTELVGIAKELEMLEIREALDA